MKKTAKKLSLLLLLIVLAVPLAWLHVVKIRETEALKNDKAQLESDLQLCQEASEVDELGLFYELNGLDVTVTQKELKFADLFTAEALEAQATGDCSKTLEEGYYETLVSKFEGVKGIQYDFTANGVEGEVYTVTLFPNAVGYATQASFEDDFEICSVGGNAYPTRMNEKALLFTGSCGAGYGEEVPALTCADIANQLTLEFN